MILPIFTVRRHPVKNGRARGQARLRSPARRDLDGWSGRGEGRDRGGPAHPAPPRAARTAAAAGSWARNGTEVFRKVNNLTDVRWGINYQ